LTFCSTGLSAEDQRSAALNLIIRIQRADYEGNRTELRQLHDALAPFIENATLRSRIHYWRGFALWRRALNGFNDSVHPVELQQDLESAAREFQSSSVTDPTFADAKVGEASCLSNLMYLNRSNQTRLQELIVKAGKVFKEAEALGLGNPRLDWVRGPSIWYASQQNEAGQSKAIEAYKRGLLTIRNPTNRSSDPLDPSWGEPELLMNLAWSQLNRRTPDLHAARSYAQAALDLVPYWRYVKDILVPQIQRAIDVAEIQKLRDRDVTASKAGDFEALGALLTDDAVIMPPGRGFVRGVAARELAMAQMREAMSQYEVLQYRAEFDELKIAGNDAVEWGTISGTLRDKRTGQIRTSSYKVMRILAKQPGGEWKISRSIYSDMPVAE
jgi:ketosteroid isomerase-like protein